MRNIIKLKFFGCRAVRRDLWDYAGERLAEGPMEQVEQHLETCAACREEVKEWKRAQTLLTTAQSEPMPSARLGWRDLQARIAADVTAFGPPRPDKNSTRQAVSQLIRPRRSSLYGMPGLSALRPALAGGMALTLAFVLFAPRATKTPQSATFPAARPTVLPLAAAQQKAMEPATDSNLAALTDPYSVSPSLTETSAKTAPVAQEDAKEAPVTSTRKPTTEKPVVKPSIHAVKAAKSRNATIVPPAKTMLATTPQKTKDDNKIKFTPRDSAATEKAPDASEVAQGVIGALVPVSHDEDNVY